MILDETDREKQEQSNDQKQFECNKFFNYKKGYNYVWKNNYIKFGIISSENDD